MANNGRYPLKRTSRKKNTAPRSGKNGQDKRIIKIITAILYLICAVLFVIYAAMALIKLFYQPDDNNDAYLENKDSVYSDYDLSGENEASAYLNHDSADEKGASAYLDYDSLDGNEASEYLSKAGTEVNKALQGSYGINNSAGKGYRTGNSAEVKDEGKTGGIGAGKSAVADDMSITYPASGKAGAYQGRDTEAGIMKGDKEAVHLNLEKGFNASENSRKSANIKNARLLFGGNVYLSSYALNAYDERGGIDGVLSPDIRSLINSSDIFMACEVFPMSDRGEPVKGKEYVYRASPDRSVILKEAGLDIVSLANNHILDYGEEALSDTLSALKKEGIAYTGAGENISEASKAVIKDINGMKTAFVGASRKVPDYSWGAGADRPGVNLAYDAQLPDYLADIKELSEGCDFVVAYLYWGGDGKAEAPDFIKRLARKTVDAGADLVVGADTSSVQGIEYYKGVPIVYSLGNFIYGSSVPEAMLLEVRLSEPDGSVKLRLHPVKAGMGYTESIDKEEKRREFFKKYDKLCINASIDEEGNVKPEE